jgi:uncharacterized membrane protein
MSDEQVQVTLVAAVFANMYEATATFNDLVKMHESDGVELVDVVVMARGFSGKLSIEEQAELTPKKGAKRGALIGAAIGVIFPPSLLAGAAIGAAAGALTGKVTDQGFENDLLHEIASELEPGQSAILAVAESEWRPKIIEAADGYDRLIERSFSASEAGNILDLE